MLARQGGDEFTALLPSISNTEDVNVVAEKLLAELRNPFLLGEIRFLATINIAIVLFPDNSTSAKYVEQFLCDHSGRCWNCQQIAIFN